VDPPSDERSGNVCPHDSPRLPGDGAPSQPNAECPSRLWTKDPPAFLAAGCGPRPGLTRSTQWVSPLQHRVVATPDPVDEDRRSSHAMGKRSLRPIIAYTSAPGIRRDPSRGGHARSHRGALVLQPLTSAPPTPTGSVPTGACGWGRAGRGVEQPRVRPWRAEGRRWA